MFSNVFNMFSCFYGDLHQLRSIRFRFSQSLAKEGMLSAVPFTLRDLCARGTLAEKTSRVEDFERLWAKSRCAAHCVRAIHLRAKNRSAPPGAPEIRHRAAPVDATWPPQRGLFDRRKRQAPACIRALAAPPHSCWPGRRRNCCRHTPRGPYDVM